MGSVRKSNSATASKQSGYTKFLLVFALDFRIEITGRYSSHASFQDLEKPTSLDSQLLRDLGLGLSWGLQKKIYCIKFYDLLVCNAIKQSKSYLTNYLNAVLLGL